MIEKVTEDKTITLFNEDYQEHYHSLMGAKKEATLKYLDPFIFRCKLDNVFILDPFFGLGFNSYVFLDYAFRCNKLFFIDAIEIDRGLYSYWNKSLLYFDDLKKNISNFEELKKNNRFNFQLGDSLKLIYTLENNKYDVILHDAFSFYKCPELWTIDIFKKYYELLKNDGMVLTYSSSKIVRAGLIESGFSIFTSFTVGNKGTLAIKNNLMESDEVLKKDFMSICSVPYRNINSDQLSMEKKRKLIIENQKKETKNY